MNISFVEPKIADMQQMLRPRPADGHKGTFGHALLIVGSRGMAGAAILSAEACLRSGIGKLSIITADDNRIILQIAVPEAILKNDNLGMSKFDSVGIGPGIGIDEDLVHQCLTESTAPMVIDADALNVLAQSTDLQDLVPQDSILTPHPGEAMRLIGSCDLKDVLQYAISHKVIVVLKGHPTRVCTPQGQVFVMNTGNSGMATAGSGDVLTGLITGLLAQGYEPLEAALLGVWLHGTAGDFAAENMGEACMLSRDIIHHLPDAFRIINNKS